MLTMIHLLIFIILTFLLISFPAISASKEKGFNYLKIFQSSKKVNLLKIPKLIPSFIYLMNLFEYMFQNNIGVHFIWTSGFVSWILGCCFWVLQANFISLTLIFFSIIFCLVAIFATSDININEFSNIKMNKLGISVYVLIISISVLAMISFNSIAVGFTTNILLVLFLYNLRVFKRVKKNKNES